MSLKNRDNKNRWRNTTVAFRVSPVSYTHLRGFYGVQFHPEVNHTEHGTQMIRTFLYQVCHAKGDWTREDYCRTAIAAIREKVGDGKVLLAPVSYTHLDVYKRQAVS